MPITVRYGAQLANAAGRDEEEVTQAGSPNLLDLLRDLAERHGPDFAKFIFDEAGAIHPSLLIAINDGQIDKEENPPLPDASELLLITPMAGG